jgi:hypothetical protein
MRWLLYLILLVSLSLPTLAQETETPTPTPTETPTKEPYLYATVMPLGDGSDEGITTRFDYVVSVGDVMVAVLLVALVVSLWAMFIFHVIGQRR